MIDRRSFLISGIVSLPSIVALPVLRSHAGDPLLLRAAPARHTLYTGKEPADVLAYNDQIPGPTIRIRKGEEVSVRFENGLDEPATVHWHGIRIENAMDGVPGMTQNPVPPGETFDYRFVAPDAGTFWYHPHMGASQQLGRGLYGPLIIDGDAKGTFDDDITLILDDWRLDENGAIADNFGNMMDASHAGRLGNWMTVNGSSSPQIQVTEGKRTRMRLINTSNARVLYLDLETLGAEVIALDGQPVSEPFAGNNRFALGPSQRADLFVVFREPGTVPFRETSRNPFTFAEFAVTGGSVTEAASPSLIGNNLPEPDLGKVSRHTMLLQGGMMGPAFEARVGNMDHLEMNSDRQPHDLPVMDRRELAGIGIFWALSGVSGTDEKPFLAAKAGEHVIIEIVNQTAWPHAMHLHGHHFRVMTRNGNREPGTPWRDTVLLEREETVEIAFVADNPGKWMIHCHMIEHQTSGMMTWMSVT